MRFVQLAIEGAFSVVPEPTLDDRGSFARVFCRDEFGRLGLHTEFSQHSVSVNTRAGTVRGMHYSVGEHAETKLVRCTGGAIHDVLVDVRPGSPSFGRTVACMLTSADRVALYIPAGVAHGFQTLSDASEVFYMIDKPYVVQAATGFRWNDPVVTTVWPLPVTAMSDRDRTYSDFRPASP